jgi:probable HAF family extracellular repeat protein
MESMLTVTGSHRKEVGMKRVNVLHAVFGLAWAAFAATAQGEVRYRLIPIEDVAGGATPWVEDLNNNGEVVGRTLEVNPRAFYWRRGHYVDIGERVSPGSASTGAKAINDGSQIVATYLDADFNEQGVLLTRRDVVQLTKVGFGTPVDINALGVILGNDGGSGSALWDRGQVTHLPALPFTVPLSSPAALNNHGVAVGMSFGSEGWRAVVWQPPYADVTQLTTIPGENTTRASDVNDLGQVIGTTTVIVGEEGLQRGFLWQDGTAVELPVIYPNQRQSQAEKINNAGLIVGATIDENGVFTATLWRNGRAHDLNRLISDHDPLKGSVRLIAANEINDKGWIAAVRLDDPNDVHTYHWYLLEPVKQ